MLSAVESNSQSTTEESDLLSSPCTQGERGQKRSWRNAEEDGRRDVNAPLRSGSVLLKSRGSSPVLEGRDMA